jgi:hypothetical protein
MNKKVATAFILLFMITGASAIAPMLVGLGGLGVIGSIAYYILGLQQKIAQLEEINQTVTQNLNLSENNADYIINSYTLSRNASLQFSKDVGNQTKPWAWTLVKYYALKTINEELNNGTDFTTALIKAKTTARDKLKQYYINATKNPTVDMNESSWAWYFTVKNLAIQARNTATAQSSYIDFFTFVTVESGTEITLSAQASGYERDGTFVTDDVNALVTMQTKSYTCNDFTIYYDVPKAAGYTDQRIGDLETQYKSALNSYCGAYQQVADNLEVYVDSLTYDLFTSGNFTELLDPVTLATQINNDAETTGYYGYAAAELALSGLNLSGLNKTVTIVVNGTTLSGILFTDWSGTLEVNKTYTADPLRLWYFIDENGQLYDLQGYNFTVVDLRDKDGNKLQNTTFERYVDHSGDIQKIYDELAKLNELYNRYLEMQTISGGGGSVGDWWANLSDTEKLAIGAAAVLLIVLIARK